MELLVATALARAAVRDAERLAAARGDARTLASTRLAPARETARRDSWGDVSGRAAFFLDGCLLLDGR